jgi:hypothetical protein
VLMSPLKTYHDSEMLAFLLSRGYDFAAFRTGSLGNSSCLVMPADFPLDCGREMGGCV